MNSFSEPQIDGLRQLTDAWRELKYCLIGASALSAQIALPRSTTDVDISLSVSVDELNGATNKLIGWKRSADGEHTWRSPQGLKVDLLPVGPQHLAAREVIWPESGTRLNLTGMRLAIEHAFPYQVGPDLTVPMAPVPVIAVLKMVAYLDQPSRERDLVDLGHILHQYPGSDDARRFSESVVNRAIPYEEAGAFVLGEEIAGLIDSHEQAAIEAFLTRVEDARHPSGAQSRMARLGPMEWRREPDALVRTLGSFRLGLSLANRS